MDKRKYLTVARQDRVGRVGARLLLSLGIACGAVLFKSTLVHAETVAPAADHGAIRMTAAVPGCDGRLASRLQRA